MKKIILVLLSLFLFPGCGQNDLTTQENKKLTVGASIFPLYSLAKTVSGEKAEVKLALPPGASPHTFSLTPGKVKEFSQVKAFFMIGHGLDDWAENLAGEKVVILDKGITLKVFAWDEHEDDDHDHNNEGVDPHYWLSPENAKVIVENLAFEFGRVDPKNKEFYAKNAKNFIGELENRNKEWTEKLDSLEKKEIFVFHGAWGYFADYFKLKIAATFELFPGKSPTLKYLANLQKDVQKNNIKIFFIEPQLSKEAISTLSRDLGVEIKVLDPLGGIGGRESYLDLIDYNVNVIYENLK